MTDVKITVDRAWFSHLEKDSHLLEILEACGVCDWEGYAEACKIFEEERLDYEV